MYSVPQAPSMDRLVGGKISPTMHSSDKLFLLAPARRFQKDSRNFPESHYALRGSMIISIRNTSAEYRVTGIGHYNPVIPFRD